VFSGLLLVMAAAFAAPFVLGFFPKVRVPAVVLEIVAGIVIGPSVLGWVQIDSTIQVLATIGLVFLLFLAGLEIEFDHLRGRVLRVAATGWLLSVAIAVVAGLALKAGGLAQTPLLVAVILSATSLGVIIPVLKDAGEIGAQFGQLVVAAGSIADFGAIILLSVLFAGKGGTGATLVLIGSLFALAFVVFAVVRGAERSARIRDDLLRLQDTTAEIRIRGAIVLLVAFAAVAEQFGLEVILGAFAAGAVLALLDRDEVMTHPLFRRKLEAIGFGVFVPVFFVTSGLRFDLDALLRDPSNVAIVPVFLVALAAVRGLPALLYRKLVGPEKALVAALFQATSLPFIVAGTAIGRSLGLIGGAESAELIAAGLLSVLLFPLIGSVLLRRDGERVNHNRMESPRCSNLHSGMRSSTEGLNGTSPTSPRCSSTAR
jgi:Kef-type K+ transport system membrane component KefB